MLYNRRYFSLQQAVQRVADRLAAADQQYYAEKAAAVEEARKQLLEALFEGTVCAEGVRCYPADPPIYESASIKYDEWHPIKPGVWSHKQCALTNDIYRLDVISVHWGEDFIDYFDSDGEWAGRID